jgi:putative ABC transport system permease protein
MNVARFAFGNLRRRPARTLLTVSAIALGIAAVVALTSIAWGFEASWQHANDARGTDLIVTRVSSENAMPSPFAAAEPQRALEAYPHVAHVVGLLSELLTVSATAPPCFVFGWGYRSYLWDHLRIIGGREPAANDADEVVLGSLASQLLLRTTGDALEIEGRRFAVVGVFETDSVVENGAVVMTLDRMQTIMDKPGKVNVLNLKLDAAAAPFDLQQIRARVQATMPGFAAITSGELVRQNAIVRLSKAMSNATMLVACLVGALVVFNTMLMAINERTREVGILLALGWQRHSVMALVLTESLALTLGGGVVGVLLGVGMTWTLEHVDLLRGKIDAVFSIPFVALTLGLCVLLGLVGGLFPALKAARMRPAQALRHE